MIALAHLRWVLRLTVVLAIGGSLGAAEARYALTDLGPGTQAVRVNAAGDVIGTTYLPQGGFMAFLFSQGQKHDLGTLGGISSAAHSLSDHGEIVGASWTGEKGPGGRAVVRPFLYAGGVMRELTVTGLAPGVGLREINEINGSGAMAGKTDESTGRLCLVAQGRATIVPMPEDFARPADMNGLEVKRINARGQVIGTLHAFQMQETGPHSWAETNSRTHGFICTDGRITDLGDFRPVDINAAGQMVGSRPAANGRAQPVFFDGKDFHDLGIPAGFSGGGVSGINATGLMVGTGSTITGGGFLWIGVNSHAFLYAENRWQDLNDLVVLEGTGLKVLSWAEGINDRGQIICQATGTGGMHAVLLTPVGLAQDRLVSGSGSAAR